MGVNKTAGKISDTSKLRVRMRLYANKTIEKKRRCTTLKASKLGSKWAVMALDSMFKETLGLPGLVSFKQLKPPKLLTIGQKRKFKAVDELPAKFRSAGRLSRACIQEADGTSRFEVVWSQPAPSLHQVLDQGSVGWADKFKLYHVDKGGLNGWFENDPPHRRHNNYHVSFARSGSKWLKAEVGLTLTVAGAPHGKSHFYGMLHE